MIEKIHRIIKINPSEHQLHLICKWPVSHENYQAVGISDDDDCHAMLELCSSEHNIELYVEKDIGIHRESEDHGHSHVCSIWIMNQQASCHQFITRKCP